MEPAAHPIRPHATGERAAPARSADPQGFAFEIADWQPAAGRASQVAVALGFAPEQTATVRPASRGPGLSSGETALAAAAAARLLGCRHSTALAARAAVDGLRQRRQVQVLLEEGIPSPVTGRLGAIISAAGALTRSPPHLSPRDIWWLEETTLDDHEMVDLIHAIALTAWNARLRLALAPFPFPQTERTDHSHDPQT